MSNTSTLSLGEIVTDTKYDKKVIVDENILNASQREGLKNRWVSLEEHKIVAEKLPVDEVQEEDENKENQDENEKSKISEDDIDVLQAEYEELSGQKPHHLLKVETLKSKIYELRNKS